MSKNHVILLFIIISVSAIGAGYLFGRLIINFTKL